MNFNIRKLKIKISCKERELREALPNSRDRLRRERDILKTALAIAMQNRADQREKAA